MQRHAHLHTQKIHKNTKLEAVVCTQRICQIKQTNKQKHPEETMKQRLSEDACESVGHPLLGVGPAPNTGLFPQRDCLGAN